MANGMNDRLARIEQRLGIPNEEYTESRFQSLNNQLRHLEHRLIQVEQKIHGMPDGVCTETYPYPSAENQVAQKLAVKPY